jgi:hypothetical protein
MPRHSAQPVRGRVSVAVADAVRRPLAGLRPQPGPVHRLLGRSLASGGEHTADQVGLALSLPCGRRYLFTGDVTSAMVGLRAPADRSWLLRHVLHMDADKNAKQQALLQPPQLMRVHPELRTVPAHGEQVATHLPSFPPWCPDAPEPAQPALLLCGRRNPCEGSSRPAVPRHPTRGGNAAAQLESELGSRLLARQPRGCFA